MAPAFVNPPAARAAARGLSPRDLAPPSRLGTRRRRTIGAPPRLRKRRKTEAPPTAVQEPIPSIADQVLRAENTMCNKLALLTFGPKVHMVYNPLRYAWTAHKWYVNTYGNSRKDILMVGMNPGPWGMAQTGVPFGEVSAVKNWMAMPPDTWIAKPETEHPKRPIQGLACKRSEVSGKRLWHEWARANYGEDPKKFFDKIYVHNFCPLMFMEKSGKNLTPVRLPLHSRRLVNDICDDALRGIVHALRPKLVIGIGGFAKERCLFALKDLIAKGLKVDTILHPSPASPQANKGWAKHVTEKMNQLEKDMKGCEDFWQKIHKATQDSKSTNA